MFRTAILDTETSEDELVGAVDDALFAAAQQGMAPMSYRFTEDPSQHETVHFWQGGYEGDELRIVEDRPMACVYAVAVSEDAKLVDEMIEALAKAFAIPDCDAVCTRLQEDAKKNPNAIMQLTVCDSKRPHAPSEELLLGFSSSEDRETRMISTQAMGILGWPPLIKRLEAMEPSETDPRIRDVIAFALKRNSERTA